MTFVSRATPGMSWIDLVRAWMPGVSDAEADAVLWDATAFPCAGVDYIEPQIAAFAADPDWERVAREIDAAMDRMLERKENTNGY